MENLDLIKTLADLGLSVILLYFLKTIWDDRKERITYKDKVIAEKDKVHEETTSKVLEVVKENTESNLKVRASIDAQIKVGEAQQRALETLTNKVYEVLIK